jgi:hypothetical protein
LGVQEVKWDKSGIEPADDGTFFYEASKEACLEANAEKIKCIFMPHHQATGHNHYIAVANESSENVAKFRYL